MKTASEILDSASSGDVESCAICLERMGTPSESRTHSCGHRFHRSCANRAAWHDWARGARARCPSCRTVLSRGCFGPTDQERLDRIRERIREAGALHRGRIAREVGLGLYVELFWMLVMYVAGVGSGLVPDFEPAEAVWVLALLGALLVIARRLGRIREAARARPLVWTLRDGDSEDGDSEDGDSEDGDSEDGDSEDGDSEDGDSEDGDSEDGDSEDGGSLPPPDGPLDRPGLARRDSAP